MAFLPVYRRSPWRGWRPFIPFPSVFDNIFAGLRPWFLAERLTPREDGGTDVRLDMPGFTSKEIGLEVYGRQLRITALHEREGDRRHVVQSYDFGYEIDAKTATASYENGVLALTLPAKGELVRRIPVTPGHALTDLVGNEPLTGEVGGEAIQVDADPTTQGAGGGPA